MSSGWEPSAPGLAIVHLFDWRFERVERALPRLSSIGFDAIQVSPPQASVDRADWWARYQPIDHTRLEGPLGNEASFRSMIAAAHRHQPPIKVIVDVVLNHMAEVTPTGEQLVYPRFGPEHFHPRAAIDWNSIESIRTGWIGYGPDLPDLRTEHPHVRAEARRYLERLIDCGADGFRFDAVKHIEPDFFDEVLHDLPQHLLRYGEYIPQPGHGPVMREYLRTMRLMDFAWLADLSEVVLNDRPLATLLAGESSGERLDGGHAVAFATNHDIELNQYGGFHLPHDAMALANALMLARPDAWSLTWHEHIDHPVVREVLRLRRDIGSSPPEQIALEHGWAAWSFGDRALHVVNASSAPLVLAPCDLRASSGGWRHPVSGERMGTLTVPPRASARVLPMQ